MANNALQMPNRNIRFASTFLGDFLPHKRPFSPSLRMMNNGAKQTAVAASRNTLAMKKVTSNSLKLGRVWKEIQGLNNWENLMEPLDSLLRDEIIRYGEFVIACYKGFDLDPNSKRYLNCKYGKSNFLEEVGLGESGYQVTKYIYVTPDINIPIHNNPSCGRWIGYIAVSNDEESKKLGRRDVVISFRGTITFLEWLANLMSSLTPARLDPHSPRLDVKVEAGFLSLYTSNEKECKFGLQSCRQQLLSEVSRVLNLYQGEEMSITIAGHSMGSSLAHLLAYDISELGLNKDANNVQVPVTVFSFGGPRVGNSCFKQRCEDLGVKVLRIVNVKDPITKLPGVFFNEGFKVLAERYDLPWSCSCYSHVGVELLLDFYKMHNPSCVHDLETYMNLLKCHDPRDLEIIKREGFDHFARNAKKLVLNVQTLKPLRWRSTTNAPLILSPTFMCHFLSHMLIF